MIYLNMKVALYSRVSTREQTTENQRLILIDHAQKQGWDFDFFEEQESSRKTRPIKNRILDMIRNKEIDAVCVLKLDRWARSVQELTDNVAEMQKRDISFISLRDNIDLSSPNGKLQFHIMSAFAEFERDLISERTKDGQARAVAQGKKLGRPKGSPDKKPRQKSGYWLRYFNQNDKVRNRKNQENYKERQNSLP